jgi:tRNA-specific adenosine deaminase 1
MNDNSTDLLANRVAQLVLDAYSARVNPYTPLLEIEWTIISGICVSTDEEGSDLRCISVGAGLKCLGRQNVLDSGQAVVDSHAEVLAARGFRLWLASKVSKALETSENDSIPEDRTHSVEPIIHIEATKVSLNPNLCFHFYSSELPCGDASMDSLERGQTEERRQLNEQKRREYEEAAKVRESGKEPEVLSGAIRGRLDYSLLGALRTKPGRPDADPADSMSCSDKIARWNVVGIAGRWLSDLLRQPIYLSTVVIGGDNFDAGAMERALHTRLEDLESFLSPPFKLNKPLILPCELPFDKARSQKRSKTSPLGAVWWEGSLKAETLVDGRLQSMPRPVNGLLIPRAVPKTSRAAMKEVFDQLEAKLAACGMILARFEGSAYKAADTALKEGPFWNWVGNGWTARERAEPKLVR